jgi:glutamyl-tRNA(Gln) amidotransferase subunit E
MIDYGALGFKAGLELHNRLATRHKLFCGCPPRFSTAKPVRAIRRKLRTVPGELGEVDPAALYEFLKGKTFVYQLFPDTTCAVELDEEPPKPLDREALLASLTVAMMLKCRLPEELHVMRKTVIDGSNTTGFQRTALVGTDGMLQTSQGPVRITNVCIEEEAAGIVKQLNAETIYRLDRLGIPLIEIGTAADLRSPEHGKEVAERLGMLVRSTGKSQRGIGSVRQDVNVSIRQGARVEIKGVQELELIPLIMENEVRRQLGLLKLRDELVRRAAGVGTVIDVTGIFRRSRSRIILAALAKDGKVLALKLRDFAGIMGTEIYAGKTFGQELLDYAKAYGAKGLIHSEEDISAYGLELEFGELYKKLDVRDRDVVLIIAGGEEAAIKAVRERCKIALKAVPGETRAANPDGTTRYMRPLPGAERMYPETDVPPIPLTREILKELKLPESWELKARRFARILPSEMVETVLRSEHLDLFETFSKKYDPVLVASTLTSTVTDLRRKGFATERLTAEHFSAVFAAVRQRTISKEAIPPVLEVLCAEPDLSVTAAIERIGLKALTKAQLREIIVKVFRKHPQLVKARRRSALMGEVMRIVRGRIAGKIVAQVLAEELARA